jgi:hypothetical protein
MKKEKVTYQQQRIDLNKTVYESAPGRDLVEAAQHLLADQACFFGGVARFEIIGARRLSASHRIQWEGREGELLEMWEFEFFTHAEKCNVPVTLAPTARLSHPDPAVSTPLPDAGDVTS